MAVFLVLQDDTGYLSTVDEYYQSNVKHILTTVTQQLKKNKDRRFTYVETAFFAMWWGNQNETTKQDVRALVASGQWRTNYNHMHIYKYNTIIQIIAPRSLGFPSWCQQSRFVMCFAPTHQNCGAQKGVSNSPNQVLKCIP